MGEDRTQHIEKRLDEIYKVISDMKEDLWSDITKEKLKTASLETQVAVIVKVAGWVLAPAIGVIVTSILYLVVKR